MGFRFGKCSICTVGFKLTDIASLQCGHTYHFACISRWIDTSKTCPICRKKSIARDIKKLFFDEAEAGLCSQLPIDGNDAYEKVEELTMQLSAEKNSRKQVQESLDELEQDVKELNVKLKQERKKTESLSMKDDKIRALESMLRDESRIQNELNMCRNRLKASDFFAFLKRKDETNDDSSIDKFLKSNGDPDCAKFLEILKTQLKNSEKQSSSLRQRYEKEISTLKKEKHELEKRNKKYKDLTVSLSEQNENLRKSLKRAEESPSTTPLKNLVNISSCSRKANKSLGFSFMEESLNKSDLLRSARKNVVDVVDIASDGEGDNDADVPILKSSIWSRNRSAPYPLPGTKKILSGVPASRSYPNLGHQSLFNNSMKILGGLETENPYSASSSNIFRPKSIVR